MSRIPVPYHCPASAGLCFCEISRHTHRGSVGNRLELAMVRELDPSIYWLRNTNSNAKNNSFVATQQYPHIHVVW